MEVLAVQEAVTYIYILAAALGAVSGILCVCLVAFIMFGFYYIQRGKEVKRLSHELIKYQWGKTNAVYQGCDRSTQCERYAKEDIPPVPVFESTHHY